MAYYVRIDGEVVLIATCKSDVDDWVKSANSDPRTKDKKITVDTK